MGNHLEKTALEGKRLLHLDELQSDWAQKGRESGFDQDTEEGQKAVSEFEDYNKNLRQRAFDAIMERAREQGKNKEDLEVINDLFQSEQSPEMLAYYAGGQDEADRYTEMRRQAEKFQSGITPAAYVTKTDDWVDLGLK